MGIRSANVHSFGPTGGRSLSAPSGSDNRGATQPTVARRNQRALRNVDSGVTRKKLEPMNRSHPIRLVLACAAIVGLSAVVDTPSAIADERAPGDERNGIDLALYDRLLERHTVAVDDVVGTRVDYAALRRADEWKRLAAQVRAARPSSLERDERLAFWINAYNILTIDLILDHYPVESIRDIGSFLFPVWNRTIATIEGRALSLGDIEHEILREMGEPRIHGAIVCASTSCPPLARSAFRAERIDEDLDRAMRRFLASPEKGLAIDRDRDRVRISKIFDWFEEDFEPMGGVRATLARYAAPADAAWLRGTGADARIVYLDYDWTLNDVR